MPKKLAAASKSAPENGGPGIYQSLTDSWPISHKLPIGKLSGQLTWGGMTSLRLSPTRMPFGGGGEGGRQHQNRVRLWL
jgi:hypothetical protein